ncbi:MAG: phosphatase PAP2 family protein [Ferrovum sp.]|nr:phosphatase PAP2 family protein [Ferrovum sp.]NDU87369.1 phosphatase PAP2 family protein [Ferrovum sp.]
MTFSAPPLSRIFLVPALALLGAGFIALSHNNAPLFLTLHALFQSLPPVLWANLTALGDAALTPLCLILFVRRRPDLLWAGLLAALLAFLFSHGLKHWVDAPRPPLIYSNLSVIGPRLLHGSFPSGHTTTIFTMIGLLILGLPITQAKFLWMLMFLACAVGLSRIALGVHWPLDVLVGAAGGWLCAGAGLVWAQRWTWGMHAGRWLPLLILGILAAYDLGRGPDSLPGVYGLQISVAVVAWIIGLKEGIPLLRQILATKKPLE